MGLRMSDTVSRSQPFTEMANRIEVNMAQDYGGSFVIMPPGDDVKPAVMLILDNSGDAAVFWGSVMTRCQIELEMLKQKEESGGFMGGMRR